MSLTSVCVILPRGLWLDGRCYREADLCPLTGNDESFLLEAGELLLPAQRTTVLLSRCLARLGPLSPVTEENVRNLTVGDREALLLHLRRLTLGNRLQCVLDCPTSDCGEKMDIELEVSDLLLPPYNNPQECYETIVSEDGADYRVRFRLPNGGDQEAMSELARTRPRAAADRLLRRCVEQVALADGSDTSVEEWPAAVAQQLPTVMAELDPQAEITLNLSCPVCKHEFFALLDTAIYFFQEMAHRMRRFYQGVHLLAFYYHWSEAEIMAMTTRKRHRYLEILQSAITREEG